MSKLYCETFGIESSPHTPQAMRVYCQRPGKMDEDGNPIYFTEQAHKDTCDVNKIIRKYDKQGLISHVSKIEAQYGDVTGHDFKTAQDMIIKSQRMFDELPSNIRKRFKNSVKEFLSFFENEENREEAIELGLIKKQWTPETDGLGEHVKEDQNVNEDPVHEPDTVTKQKPLPN